MGNFLFNARRNHTLQIGEKIVAGGHMIRLDLEEAEAKLLDHRLEAVDDNFKPSEPESEIARHETLDPVASVNESVKVDPDSDDDKQEQEQDQEHTDAPVQTAEPEDKS